MDKGITQRAVAYAVWALPPMSWAINALGNVGTACSFFEALDPAYCRTNAVIAFLANMPPSLALGFFAVGAWFFLQAERKHTHQLIRKDYAAIEGKVAGMETSLGESVRRIDDALVAQSAALAELGERIDLNSQRIAEVGQLAQTALDGIDHGRRQMLVAIAGDKLRRTAADLVGEGPLQIIDPMPPEWSYDPEKGRCFHSAVRHFEAVVSKNFPQESYWLQKAHPRDMPYRGPPGGEPSVDEGHFTRLKQQVTMLLPLLDRLTSGGPNE